MVGSLMLWPKVAKGLAHRPLMMIDRSTDKKLVSSHWVASEKLQRKLLVLIIVLVLVLVVVVVVGNHFVPPSRNKSVAKIYLYRLVYPVVVAGGHGTSPALSNDEKLSFVIS